MYARQTREGNQWIEEAWREILKTGKEWLETCKLTRRIRRVRQKRKLEKGKKREIRKLTEQGIGNKGERKTDEIRE